MSLGANSGLIQDDVLGELMLVAADVKPASPSTLHSIGAIVEATVLHDVLYHRPVQIGSVPGTGINLGTLIDASPLVERLTDAGVLKKLPMEEAQQELDGLGAGYSWGDFLGDYYWRQQMFLTPDPAAQMEAYQWARDLLLNHSAIYGKKRLTELDQQGGHTPVESSAKELVEGGVPCENIVLLEGWNHKAAALVDLSAHLRLNLYVVDTFVPHQLGYTESRNAKVRQLYERVVQEAKILEGDEDVGHTGYATVPVPALALLVLQSCLGDLHAFPDALLEIRDKHAGFRRTLTDFEHAWSAAGSRRDRSKLEAEFKHALTSLVKDETRPADRLVYKLWDVVKEPGKVIARIGDKLAAAGRRERIIGQVRGFGKFWDDLLEAPVAEQSHRLVERTFARIAETEVWRAGQEFAEALRRRVKVQ